VSLRIVPVTFDTACRFVEMWHRHHQPPVGHKFSLGVADDLDVLRGVAIAGRPVSRLFDDGLSLEVTRSATDGARNANSMLYAAAWQAGKALGYRRLVTYTHTQFIGPVCEQPCDHGSCWEIRIGESGASLRAVGWVIVAARPARPGWNTPSRPRELNGSEGIPRTLWEAS
jgi:hypothetical protein